MRLLVTTPMSVIIDADDINHIRAEDETGAFGILPGHADFLTVLPISVLTWRNGKGGEHHVALRGGVLTMKDGNLVEVATRDAVGDDTLRQLGVVALERFQEEMEADEASRVSATRLHLATIRQLERYLECGRRSVLQTPVIEASRSKGRSSRKEVDLP